MLTASILKIFYWPGARYDTALLVQAFITVAVQALLLKVALDNRPVWRGGGGEEPFRSVWEGGNSRPWGFWTVRSPPPFLFFSKKERAFELGLFWTFFSKFFFLY